MGLILPPEAPVDPGSQEKREAVEKALRLSLPTHLYEFAAAYGSVSFGTDEFSGVLEIFNPFSEPFVEKIKHWSSIWNKTKLAEGDSYIPYDIYPKSPGLLPCGRGEGRRVLFWLTEAESDKWPLVLWPPEKTFHQFSMPLADFLVRLFTGKVGSFGASMGSEWFKAHQRDFVFIPAPDPPADHAPRNKRKP
jgi:hypothetical protein